VSIRAKVASAFAALSLCGTTAARATDFTIAPFIGFQYGGVIRVPGSGRTLIEPGLHYGGLLDVGVTDRWGAEILYSRQGSDLERSRGDVTVERYLAGVREEEGERIRFRGAFLMGLTRMALDGVGSEVRYTLAASLGARTALSRHFGVRADARVYYVVISAGGTTACVNGACLFATGGSGTWQGDVTAALEFHF